MNSRSLLPNIVMRDIDSARDALYSIPSDLSRDLWVRVGMAAHAAGLEFVDFDCWSKPAGSYNAQTCQTTWRSFKTTPGGVGAGTLFAMARDHGWTAHATPKSVVKLTHSLEPQHNSGPANRVSEIFARFETATDQHHYIHIKKGNPNGLRVVPRCDRLTILGRRMAGYLAVPAYALDGEIQSIQFIPPHGGDKLNLPGANLSGACFTLGIDGPAYLCEGIGAAWSAWQSTGHRAVCCFGWGNVSRIAAQLRKSEPDSKLIICPDVGKEIAAAKIAAEYQCAVITMPDGWSANSDINDLYCSPDGGFDVVSVLLESATDQPKPTPLLKPVSVFDVITNPSPPPRFVWKGYLPRGTVTLLGAHGGAGKSTIALMLAVCSVLGRPLFGVDTEPCKVLFLSLEDGSNVVRYRLACICKAWLIDPEQLRDRLLIVDGTEHPELFVAETRGSGEISASYFELRKLVESRDIGLVLIDNASDAFGGDEIQRRQVRAFMRALAKVARLSDPAVLLLAHVDKTTSRNRKADGGEGYSGSTAWHNSARSRLFLTSGEDGLLTLEHQKSNFGKKCGPLTLNWFEGGFPQVFEIGGIDCSHQQARADDERAIALLKLIAEFESRAQYCSPVTTARNNVHAVLRSEPGFQKLKLNGDSTKRIVNQCQRANWLEPIDYRTYDRKSRQRWTVTSQGRVYAGLNAPFAPTAPS